MNFAGYLLKSGNTQIPGEYIKEMTYSVTPNQRLEESAKRNTNGVLVRSTLSHTASKIEFDTMPLDGARQTAFMTLLRGLWSSELRRDIQLTYYDMETDTYKTGNFYMPDIQWKIKRITGNHIDYDSTRIAFIEY